MHKGNATSGMGVPKPDVAHDVYDVLVNEEPITAWFNIPAVKI